NYHLEEAQGGYYTIHRPGEPPGFFFGRGAEALGLIGADVRKVLPRLMDGFTPKGSCQGAGKDHMAGQDLTFSAPKSVSAVWAVGDAQTRAAIEQAHRDAVSEALRYLEETAGWCRTGKGGRGRLMKAALTFARFEHGTNRNGDFQLHEHALCLNVG